MLLGVGFLLALLLLATLALDPQGVLDRPDRLIFPIALVIATAIFSGATQASDRDHRREAVLDPLTGPAEPLGDAQPLRGARAARFPR